MRKELTLGLARYSENPKLARLPSGKEFVWLPIDGMNAEQHASCRFLAQISLDGYFSSTWRLQHILAALRS
jgi:hypothetical protein